MFNRRNSRNNSRNNRRNSRNNSRNSQNRNQRGGNPSAKCAQEEYIFNTACVKVCPPGTYPEPEKLPLTCSSDTWSNRAATKVRLSAKKAAAATVEASKKAASATKAWAQKKKAEMAHQRYLSYKKYVAEYEAALARGQDVAQIPAPKIEEEHMTVSKGGRGSRNNRRNNYY
jgi:hypothetical protein